MRHLLFGTHTGHSRMTAMGPKRLYATPQSRRSRVLFFCASSKES